MKKNILWVVLIIVVGAGAFFGGMKYQQSKRSTQFRDLNGTQGRVQGQRQGAGNRMGFRPVNGEIISSDDTSITVKLTDGGSKIVIFSDKTEINKAAVAIKDDLKIGEKVAVFGQENSDGSVTAQSIQLNPTFGNMISPAPTN